MVPTHINYFLIDFFFFNCHTLVLNPLYLSSQYARAAVICCGPYCKQLFDDHINTHYLQLSLFNMQTSRMRAHLSSFSLVNPPKKDVRSNQRESSLYRSDHFLFALHQLYRLRTIILPEINTIMHNIVYDFTLR